MSRVHNPLSRFQEHNNLAPLEEGVVVVVGGGGEIKEEKKI